MTEWAVTLLTEEADPLADVIVNMAEEGEGFLWHFDTNNFTIMLSIQSAEEGGLFKYAPNIRAEDKNFPAVRAVLEGTSDLVRYSEQSSFIAGCCLSI